MMPNDLKELKKLSFYDRVTRGHYTPRYWVNMGLPLPESGVGYANLTLALWESFRHDLLDHHGQYTKRPDLRLAPEVLPMCPTIPKPRGKNRPTKIPDVKSRESAFAIWAHKMLTESEAAVNDAGRCQSPAQNQVAVMHEFSQRLESFRRSEKLASLPLTASIEDKIDAGYYQVHGYEQFRRDLLKEAGFTGLKREMDILRKAEEIADGDGMDRVVSEFRSLVDLMSAK